MEQDSGESPASLTGRRSRVSTFWLKVFIIKVWIQFTVLLEFHGVRFRGLRMPKPIPQAPNDQIGRTHQKLLTRRTTFAYSCAPSLIIHIPRKEQTNFLSIIKFQHVCTGDSPNTLFSFDWTVFHDLHSFFCFGPKLIIYKPLSTYFTWSIFLLVIL